RVAVDVGLVLNSPLPVPFFALLVIANGVRILSVYVGVHPSVLLVMNVARLLEVLVVRPSALAGFELLARLRSHHLLLLLLLSALFFGWIAILIVMVSRAHERRQPDTTG